MIILGSYPPNNKNLRNTCVAEIFVWLYIRVLPFGLDVPL